MTRLAMLVHPSANRVYAQASVALTEAELAAFGDSVLGGRLGEIATEQIGGVPYVCFSVADLTEADLGFLANVSTAYALFARGDHAKTHGSADQKPQVGEWLGPLGMPRLDRYDDDLLTVLKYPGKTNETFTKLLLNLTVLASDAAPRMTTDRLRVFDPLCGRGTTLNQALMYGYDAAGIDLDRADFDAYAAFVGTWLKRKRLKHQVRVHPVRHSGQEPARRLEAELAPDRESYARGELQRLDVVHANTVRCGEFFKPGSVDVVVADAPYGVQHGSRSGAPGMSRRPLDLLSDGLPVWARLLRPGGAIGISWNTRVAARERVVEVFASAGLQVVAESPYLGLAHRVDQSINRDIIVARLATESS